MTKSASKTTYNLDEMAKRKSIVIQADSQQVTNIKTLLSLQPTQVEDLGNDIHELNIQPVLLDLPELLSDLNDMGVDDLDENPPVRTIKIESFANATKFYQGASQPNGYKIISDEFSNILNTELYKGFSAIERKLRQLVIENFQFKGRTAIEPRRGGSKKAPDHIMAQFELGDFFENLLKAPASEPYMKAEWRKSTTKSENDVIRIANLTVLDEIKPGLTLEELESIRKQRNKCMHFSVVTPAEYKKIVPIMNQYLRHAASLELGRKFKVISQGLQNYFANLIKVTSPITKFATAAATIQTEHAKVFTEAFKKMLDSEKDI
jgi:hypothetical protein